jgi:exosortase
VQYLDHLFWNERWRLAALSKFDLARIGLVACMVGLGFVLFHLQGNTADIHAFGRSVLTWMYNRWSDSSASFGATDYSHGFLIPMVAAWVLWHRRRELGDATKKVSLLGLLCLVGALLLHWVGAKSQHPRLSLFALIGIFWSVPFYLYGWNVAKWLMFPCAYLIFCVPLNFLDDLTFPLQMVMIKSSSALLNGLGVAVESAGTKMTIVQSQCDFDVAAPCSGLRSLLAMTALTAVYAYLTQDTILKKWALFLCSVPLAVAGNMARITSIVLVSEVFGQEFALGTYHDYSGYVVFAVAIGLMVAVGGMMNTDYKETWLRWKSILSNPTSLSSA